MVFSLKKDGVWRNAVTAYVNVNGTWKVIDEAKRNDNGTWKLFHQNIIEETATNAVNLNAQNLFSSSDWSNSVPKRVIIPSGVTIGSTNTSLPAFRTGTGRGGTLEVIIEGEVQGAGGAANGGAGGGAVLIEQATDVILTGAVRGGGGGGGNGGTGGTGYYQTNEDSGWQYSRAGHQTWVKNQYGWSWYWYSSYLGSSSGTTMGHGGYTYHRGSLAYQNYQESGDHENFYYIKRTRTLTHYTSGGAGGNGGVGQGYGQAQGGPAGGAAGGTNAGTGGTGGWGATWGANASNGATGASGNYAGGTAGGAGGAAGYAFSGNSLLTLTNSGTVNGSTV
jgi:hypothetical protein